MRGNVARFSGNGSFPNDSPSSDKEIVTTRFVWLQKQIYGFNKNNIGCYCCRCCSSVETSPRRGHSRERGILIKCLSVFL